MCPHDLLYTNCSKRVPICVFAEDLPPGPDNHSDDKVADLVDSAKMPAVSADGRTEDLPKAASESVGTSSWMRTANGLPTDVRTVVLL